MSGSKFVLFFYGNYFLDHLDIYGNQSEKKWLKILAFKCFCLNQ